MRKLIIIALIMLIPSVCYGGASREFEDDTSTDYLRIDDADDVLDMVSNTTDSSMYAWVNVEEFQENPDDAFRDNIFALSDDSSGDGYGFTVGDHTNTAYDNAILYTAGSNSGEIDPEMSINTWHFVVAIFEQSNDNLYIYVDNDSKHSDTGYTENSASTTTDVTIGANDGLANHFDGKLAHVMVRSTFSEYEREEMMWKPCSLPTLACWTMFGGSSEIDISGNGSDLTVTGTTESNDGPPVMFGGGLPL